MLVASSTFDNSEVSVSGRISVLEVQLESSDLLALMHECREDNLGVRRRLVVKNRREAWFPAWNSGGGGKLSGDVAVRRGVVMCGGPQPQIGWVWALMDLRRWWSSLRWLCG